MSRPNKSRKIFSNPGAICFEPVGVSQLRDSTVILTLDEFEALRLADFEGLYHRIAAEKMDVSRQTFGNILNSARKKLADFIINVKTLKIEGGTIEYVTEDDDFICFRSRLHGNEKFQIEKKELCPNCISPHLHRRTNQNNQI